MDLSKILMASVVGAGILFVHTLEAEAQDVSTSPHSNVCAGIVEYAHRNMGVESLAEVITAQTNIMLSDKDGIGDMEKFVGITIFLNYQMAAYNWQYILDTYGSLEEWNREQFGRCLNAMNNYEVTEKVPTAPTFESIW
jgi:hypothetical protein